MLGRAALRGRNHPHAYLVLLRIEVAAFHPVLSGSRTNPTPGRHPGGAGLRLPSTQTRLCGPIPERQSCCHAWHPTAVSRYPARWSPDLPRCESHTAIAQLALQAHCMRAAGLSWRHGFEWACHEDYHRCQREPATSVAIVTCDNSSFAVCEPPTPCPIRLSSPSTKSI